MLLQQHARTHIQTYTPQATTGHQYIEQSNIPGSNSTSWLLVVLVLVLVIAVVVIFTGVGFGDDDGGGRDHHHHLKLGRTGAH